MQNMYETVARYQPHISEDEEDIFGSCDSDATETTSFVSHPQPSNMNYMRLPQKRHSWRNRSSWNMEEGKSETRKEKAFVR